jgi:mRNA interferase MazF
LDNKQGWIVIDQIRTVDKKRLIKILGRLKESEIKKVKEVIKETFVD